MPTIYPTFVYHNPSYSKCIYERTHHKTLDFWFKTCYLDAIHVDSVEIKKNDSDQSQMYSYNAYAQSKMKKGSWNIDGGSCKVIILKTDQNIQHVKNIVDNIKNSAKSFSYVDVVLRNCNTNNILQLNMISSISYLQTSEIAICINMHYLAMKA